MFRRVLAFSQSIAASTRCFFFTSERCIFIFGLDSLSILITRHPYARAWSGFDFDLHFPARATRPVWPPLQHYSGSRVSRKKGFMWARATREWMQFHHFWFHVQFFPLLCIFFISPCMLLETVCAVLMHICTYKEMSLFFLFSWEMRRHTKKCAQLAFFRCFDVRWHCSKVFYMFSVLADRHNNASAMAMASKNSRKSPSLPTHIGLTYRKNI